MIEYMIRLMRKHVSPPILKLSLLMGIVWAAIVGPLSSILILKELGATSQQVGVFSAICAVISMVCQPMWGFLSDRIGSPRRVLCFCLGVSAVFFACVLLTRNLYVAMGLFFVETLFRCCAIPLLDSHTLSEINVIPGLQYSHIRMVASVFYGGFSLMYSGIINARGALAIVPISLGVAALAVLWGLFAAKGKWESKGNHGGGVRAVRPSLKKDAAALLQNRRYIVFLAFAALWAFSMMPLYTFTVDYVAAVGGNPGDVPMIYAIACAAEVPVFLLIGSVGRRVRAKKLMLIGMCFSLLYMTGLLFANTLPWLIVFRSLNGPGFILGLTGRMRYITELTPESMRSTSITLMGACEVGLGAVAGNLIAGFVSGRYGTRVLTLVAITALCASMCVLVLALGPPRSGKTEEKGG